MVTTTGSLVLAASAWSHGDWINLCVAAGTLGLAGMTALLVWKTGDMAGATRASIAAEDARLERTLAGQEEVRKKDREIDAVLAILDGIEASRIEPGDFDSAILRPGGEVLRRRMWSRVDLISEAEIQRRVRTCIALLQLLRWTPENLAREGFQPEDALMVVPETVQSTELSLEAYIAGRPLPPWDHLPASPGFDVVLDWLAARSGRKPAPSNAPD